MDFSSITSVTGLDFNDPAVANRATGKQTLDANDFLRLLSVQLSSQDPLKPMEDTQFIAQMASFSSLEQMRGLSDNFKAYTASQRLVTAQNYLGKVVTVTTDNGDVTGEVTGITIKDGEPQLLIGAGSYDASTVTSVKPKSATTNSSEPRPPVVGAGPTAATAAQTQTATQ